MYCSHWVWKNYDTFTSTFLHWYCCGYTSKALHLHVQFHWGIYYMINFPLLKVRAKRSGRIFSLNGRFERSALNTSHQCDQFNFFNYCCQLYDTMIVKLTAVVEKLNWSRWWLAYGALSAKRTLIFCNVRAAISTDTVVAALLSYFADMSTFVEATTKW